ncbi:hypothetical protein [Nakamurella aerolata]|uniref:Uncharacterized protein n=1 Tax=Nakamurella aerolata TaxID=1656892 RepID=A0A849A779_9ACTN|nr:hypothetical protein [Nakamurella aerolata]NNG36824.1 hypothetical protein [Nakamurella aerolata]
METVIGIIAFIVTLVGVLAALGYTGYLYQLQRVAQQRAGGEAAIARVRKRMPVSLGASGAAILGLLLTMGGIPLDVVGIILGGGAGLFAAGQLKQANKQL